MDWLQFSVEMTKALTWPLAALAGVLLLRRNLRRWFIDRPSKMRIGPAEFEWDAAISEVRSDLEAAARNNANMADSDITVPGLRSLSEHDPFAEALATYSKIEATLKARLEYLGHKPERRTGIRGLVREALKHDIIWDSLAQSIMKLADLKNMAVHEFSTITEGQSYEFALTAAQVYGQLTSLEIPGLDTVDSAPIYCGANALVLDEEGRILVLKVSWAEDWVLPGGNIGWGETPSAACIRSVAEQLEIVVEVSSPEIICWHQENSRKSTISFLFNVGQLSKVQRASMSTRSEEIQQVEYVKVEEIGEYLDPEMSSVVTPETLTTSLSYIEFTDPFIKPIRASR